MTEINMFSVGSWVSSAAAAELKSFLPPPPRPGVEYPVVFEQSPDPLNGKFLKQQLLGMESVISGALSLWTSAFTRHFRGDARMSADARLRSMESGSVSDLENAEIIEVHESLYILQT